MRKLIFYFLLSNFALLLFLNADAQTIALGIKGGLSIPNLTAGGSSQNPLNTGYSSRFGPDAGIFAEFKISDQFSIQPNLEYSSQGGKKDGLQAFPNSSGQGPTYFYANFKSTAKLNYLMLPILAKFGWDFKSSHFRFYVDAGPFLGYLVYAKQVTSGSSLVYADAGGTQPISPSPQSFDNTTDIKDMEHKFNVGFEGGVGFAYKLKKGSIFIEGGGNYGFINIQKGTADGQNNIGAGTVAFGYSFWVGK